MESELIQSFLTILAQYKVEETWIKSIRYYNDMMWLNYSLIGMIPLFILTAYRFFNPLQDEMFYLNKKNFKRDKLFFFERILTGYGFYYYIIDTSLTLIEGSYTDLCRFSFLTHHVPSIPLVYFIDRLNYMHWWTLIIAAWHSLLIAFPDFLLLNYAYLSFILTFHYMHAYKKPYCTVGVYKNASKVFPFLYIALVVIWWSDCKNILPFI